MIDTRVLESHRPLLWNLAYRMTGLCTDADDVVQETFARALESPPPRVGADAPLRPWLVRVAVNLARDALRRRKRRGYVGSWLPEPVDFERVPAPENESPEARYGLAETASFAFLLALEALTPRERAVLLLRDMLDYDVRETAAVLATSEGAVKVAHHRARKALERYDGARVVPSPELVQRSQEALMRLLTAAATGDARALADLLSEDARTVNDAGGQYLAARRPVLGRDKVSRYYLALAPKNTVLSSEWLVVNGLPALLVEFADPPPRQAPRGLLQVELAPDGRIREIHVLVAPDKLARLMSKR
jgi:RNA polymerase sigma-70 factor (ECF subfamily)